MAKQEVITGYSKNGLPYVCIGNNPNKLVILEGLTPNHRPPSGFSLKMTIGILKPFTNDFKVYYIGRKPDLPTGYSIRDMSKDYATMIRDEIGAQVNVMGLSTGGSIAQHLAADHPDLVNRLVLAMSGYRLTEQGAEQQKQMSDLVQEQKWRAAAVTLATAMTSGAMRPMLKVLFWILGKRVFGSPSTLSDVLIEGDAEDKHDFKKRLREISVPTLVIGGDQDFYYPIRETAAEIPSAELVLYEGVGHMAIMKRQFSKDVLAFLTESNI